MTNLPSRVKQLAQLSVAMIISNQDLEIYRSYVYLCYPSIRQESARLFGNGWTLNSQISYFGDTHRNIQLILTHVQSCNWYMGQMTTHSMQTFSRIIVYRSCAEILPADPQIEHYSVGLFICSRDLACFLLRIRKHTTAKVIIIPMPIPYAIIPASAIFHK